MRASPRGRTLLPAVLIAAAGAVGALGAEPASDAPPGGWLGVMLAGAADAEEGVRISRIVLGSPAERAGLREGDRVRAVDGTVVGTREELAARIRGAAPGSWLALRVTRRGTDRELRVRLDEAPSEQGARRLRRGFIGIDAIELPTTLREHFGAPPDAGVMVAHVEPGSPAEAAGLVLGDVVYEIDGEPVASVRVLAARVAEGGVGNDCEILVARDGATLVLEARIESAPAEP
jgi:serine protease Do